MAERLTKEVINTICDLVQDRRILEAIKTLRMAWLFGLKEAKDFLDQHGNNITGLRNKLLEMADLKEGTVFENDFLRVEVKRTGASFSEAHKFLMEILSVLYPTPDFQERRAAFLHAAEIFLDGVSFEDANQLRADLIDKVVKSSGLTRWYLR